MSVVERAIQSKYKFTTSISLQQVYNKYKFNSFFHNTLRV